MQIFAIAKALVLNEANELLLIRRGQGAPRRPGEWDLPGGFVDEGEDPLRAALREVHEETGIKLASAQLVYGQSEPDSGTYGNGSGTWLTFAARVQGQPKVTLSHEHDEYQWVTLQQAMQDITYGRQLTTLGYLLDNNVLDGVHDA